jgi:hypothetical protein
MKIDAEKNCYHGDQGWESDPQLFAQVAVTWNQWIGQAGEHLYAAQVFLPHIQQRDAEIQHLMDSGHRGTVQMAPSLTGIYFLHCAFSIENSFKCVIATERRVEIEGEIRNTNKIPKLLLTHDLVGLAAKAGFTIGTDEEYTLAFLSRYGVWAGRYPLPVRNDHNALTDKLSNGNHYLMAGHRLDQVPAFSTFAATIYTWAREKVGPPEAGGSSTTPTLR